MPNANKIIKVWANMRNTIGKVINEELETMAKNKAEKGTDFE